MSDAIHIPEASHDDWYAKTSSVGATRPIRTETNSSR